jgi:hypothetical protein
MDYFPFAARWVIVAVITIFLPLSAASFFWFRIGRKQNEYDKVISTFGITKKKDVRDIFRVVDYLLPVLFVTFVSFMGAIALVFPGEIFPDLLSEGKSQFDSPLLSGLSFGNMNPVLQRQALSMMAFAFLGSFLWSSKEIVFRLLNNDLVPGVFYAMGIRIFIASSVALVFFFVVGNGADSWVLGGLPWLALFTGMVPDRAIDFLIERFKVYTYGKGINDATFSLDRIEGIDVSHRERLAEENIHNAQNLATASLTQLIIRTPYEARQILDWIGQAKLLCYMGKDMDKCRSVGIRTVYDFFKGNKGREALREMGEAAGLNTPILEVVYEQVRDDLGVQTLNSFQNRINGDNTGAQYYYDADAITPPIPNN